jgi:hypothetical protein
MQNLEFGSEARHPQSSPSTKLCEKHSQILLWLRNLEFVEAINGEDLRLQAAVSIRYLERLDVDLIE